MPAYRRSCCGVLVQGATNTLIDATPDLRAQLVREGIDRIDSLFLTHGHYDHLAGLGELEFYVRLKTGEELPAWMSSETSADVRLAYGFMEDCLSIRQIEAFDSVAVDGLCYTALPARHANGTFGYLIENSSDKRVAYFPDTGPLPKETAWRLQGIDVLVLDATFWAENWTPDSHNTVESAVEASLGLGVKQVYLTHLSMHYATPVTSRELKDYLHQQGENLDLAYDGLRIEL